MDQLKSFFSFYFHKWIEDCQVIHIKCITRKDSYFPTDELILESSDKHLKFNYTLKLHVQEKLRKRPLSGNRRNISISRGSKQRANRKLRNADRRLILRQETKRFEETFRKSRVKIEAECREHVFKDRVLFYRINLVFGQFQGNRLLVSIFPLPREKIFDHENKPR